jgi:ATP:corrinoid adenosyltransferase
MWFLGRPRSIEGMIRVLAGVGSGFLTVAMGQIP